MEILEICDGTRTVSEVFQHEDRTGFDADTRRTCIVELLTSGLVSLHDRRVDHRVARGPLARIEVCSIDHRSEVHA